LSPGARRHLLALVAARIADPNSCPRCCAPIEFGYGFAFGGGIGTYEFCSRDARHYVHKAPDTEDGAPCGACGSTDGHASYAAYEVTP
jgi:hypothetical protein